MTDIATLGYQIQSGTVVEASKNLDAMTDSAKKAEKAADDLGKASQRSEGYLKRIAAATESSAKANSQVIDLLKQMTKAQADAKASADALGAAQAAAAAKATAAAKAEAAAVADVAKAEKQQADAMTASAMAAEKATKADVQATAALRQEKVVAKEAADASHALGSAHHSTAAAFKVLGQEVTLNRTQMMESVHVARALFDTMLAGGDPIRAVALESGRVAQIMGAGEGGMAGSMAVLSRLMPVVMGAAGFLGLAAAIGVAAKAAYDYTDAQDQLALSLVGVGRQSGATTLMLEQMAETHAQTARIGVSAAREQEEAYLSAGISNLDVIGKLIDISTDYARATHQGPQKANEELAKSFADPVRGVETMIDRLGGIDGATKRYIIDLAEHNRLAEAQATLLGKVADRLQPVEDHVNALTKVLEGGATAWSNFWNAAGKGVSLGVGLEGKDQQTVARYNDPFTSGFGLTHLWDGGKYKAAQARIAAKEARDKADAQAQALMDGQDKVSRDAYSAFDSLKPTDGQRTQIKGQVEALKAYRDEMQHLYETSDHTASGLARVHKAQQMLADGTVAAQHKLEGLDRRDAGPKGPKGPAYASGDKVTADAQRELDRAKAAYSTDILENAALQKKAVDDELASELASVAQKRLKNVADKEVADAAYTEAATLKKQVIDRRAQQELIAQQAANARTLAQYGDEELQILSGTATTLRQRRSIELQLLSNRQAEASADLERKIAAPGYKEHGGDADAERAGLAGVFQAQDRQLKKATQGPLADYFDSIKDINTQLQETAVDGLRTFNSSLVDIMTNSKDAGQILDRFIKRILADLENVALNKAEKGLGKALKGFDLGSFFGGGSKDTDNSFTSYGLSSASGPTIDTSLPSMPQSYDGGGYTGAGPRSGGLDGKGGFWGVLHPQETVTDHTKGQAVPGQQSFDMNAAVAIMAQALAVHISKAGAVVHRDAVAQADANLRQNLAGYQAGLQMNGTL